MTLTVDSNRTNTLPNVMHCILDCAQKVDFPDRFVGQIQACIKKSTWSFLSVDRKGRNIIDRMIGPYTTPSNQAKIQELLFRHIFTSRDLPALHYLLNKDATRRVGNTPYAELAVEANWTDGVHMLYQFSAHLQVAIQANGKWGSLLGICSITTDPIILHMLLHSEVNPNSRMIRGNHIPQADVLWQQFAYADRTDEVGLFLHYGANPHDFNLNGEIVLKSVSPAMSEFIKTLYHAITNPVEIKKENRSGRVSINKRCLPPIAHAVECNSYEQVAKFIKAKVPLDLHPPLFCFCSPGTDPRIILKLLQADLSPFVFAMNYPQDYPVATVAEALSLEPDPIYLQALVASIFKHGKKELILRIVSTSEKHIELIRQLESVGITADAT